MLKKMVGSFLVLSTVLISFTGCSSSTKSSASSGSDNNSKPQTINFWYHSADTVSDAYYTKMFDELNKKQSKYTFAYTSFAFADFQNKFQMAVTTNTMPDVVSLGSSNIATFVQQNSLMPLTDYTGKITEYNKVDKQLVESVKSVSNGVLYGIPYAYNQETAWYNKTLFSKNNITPPKTQKEFLDLSGKYSDKASGKYFYSLRGVRPYDSLLAWLFTYTDGAGNGGSWFNKDGKCILSDQSFVEALDAYVNIYKKGQVSGNSVNNNFNEVVAEFGSGVSMYIIHNSSSEATHLKNLGQGNFAAARVLANDKGHYYASGLQPNVYCLANQGKDHDYSGALALISYLTSAEYEGPMCETIGRVPANNDVASQDWYKKNESMKLYASYLTDKNYIQIQNPYWLSQFSTFITDDMTADFQSVLLGKMTSKDCLQKWATTIDKYQKEYLATKK